MNNNKKKFLIIDTILYIYKIYYALKKNNLNIKKIIIIFINIILKKIKYFNIEYIFFISDKGICKTRKNIYKLYKSNRQKQSKKFKYIAKQILLFLKFINIKNIYIKNIEADDIICSLTMKIKLSYNHNYIIYILSNDKDLTQLVNKNIYLIIHNNKILDINGVKKKYGVYPKLIKDLLILSGDKSDNIPGIKGIGIKTAIILLNKIGNLTSIYKNLLKIKFIKLYNNKKIIYNLINYKYKITL